MERETYFVVCAPGLEALTSAEMRGIGLLPKPAAGLIPAPVEPARAPRPEFDESGGVIFEGFREHAYRANLLLRSASRILLRIGEFNAVSFSELRGKAAKLPWERFLQPKQAVNLRVTSHASRLYHTGAVAERMAGAIADHMRQPAPPIERGGALVVVRLVKDRVTVSVDTSGQLLHRRGYRLATAKAPLRETLAAAMLLASGWDTTAPLLDPFCGSGTIPIEAAQIAARIPPGLHRRFAFMDAPDFDAPLWQSLVEKYSPLLVSPPEVPLIFASDRDDGAVRSAAANAERAGVAAWIDFSTRAVSSVEPPAAPGWVVTNPPYGLRLSENQDLRNLYAQLGNVLRAKFPGWQAAVLSSDLSLLAQTGLDLQPVFTTTNGGVTVRLAAARIP